MLNKAQLDLNCLKLWFYLPTFRINVRRINHPIRDHQHTTYSMIAPEMPGNEVARQAAVDRYSILDSLPEANFDNITALMSQIAETPISLITMLDHDRNYLKSHHGVPFNESPRNISFCGHAINSSDPIMIVNDALDDSRFADNPLVAEHGVRFYAGSPLVTPDGYRLGTLCVFDSVPRELNSGARTALITLAKQVEIVLEHRRANQELVKINTQLITAHRSLKTRNQELQQFAHEISHDIKSPIANIALFSNILADDYHSSLGESGLACIDSVQNSAESLCKYIDGILLNYTDSKGTAQSLGLHSLSDTMQELVSIAPIRSNVTLSLPKQDASLYLNKTHLLQILLNLVTNAIKYNDKDAIDILVEYEGTDTTSRFSVSDNGIGIPNEQLDSIFDPFVTVASADQQGNISTGIGLSKVKKLVTDQGGEIKVRSIDGEGSCFSFTLPKLVPNELIPNKKAA